MARPLRVAVPDGVYHVIARGNGRQSTFLDEFDHLSFLDVFQAVLLRFGWHCLTYCLMGNHYHLVVRTPNPNLSLGMRHLNGVYAQRFNRRHATCGHVFQGRFKSTLVDRDSYLQELARYVALNPVRAGACRAPEEWRWSAHRALIGVAEDRLVDARGLLAHFGPDLPRARHRYREFVEDADGDPWASDDGATAGAQELIGAHMPSSQPSPEIPRKQWQPNRPSLDSLLGGRSQDEFIQVAYSEFGYRMREIAEVLGCHYATVSRRLKAVEARRTTQRT